MRLRQRRGGEGASRHLLAALGLALAALAGLRPQVGHGAAWRPSGLSSSPVYALTADPSAPGVLYAALLPGGAVPSGLRKTVDSGRTWLETMRGLPRGFEPTALAIAPQDGRTVLVAGVDGLYRSTAAGASWTEVRVPLPPITALLIDREHPGTIIAGTELHGNFRSTDDGLTWFEANGGLLRDHYGTIPGAVALAQHPKNPQIIYMGANGFDGFYRSLDGGQTWQVANSGLPGRSVRGLVVDPGAPDTIYAVTEKGLARSTDAGATWQALETLPPIDPVAVQVEPGRTGTLDVAGTRGALYRSTNGGGSWVELPALPRPVRALAAWPGATTPMLAAAAGEGVWELSLFPTLPASPLPAGRDRQYFPQTGHNVSPTFYSFFMAMGGVERFGLPRTEEMEEDGLLVQWFQRGRLEYHPERKGTPYEVQISLIGERLLGPDRPPRAEPFESGENQRYFEETGHSVSYAFLRYFETRGGIDSFGYPITEELTENGRPVQYFQRARFEYVPENAGTRNEVQLGLIGDELLRQRGWLD